MAINGITHAAPLRRTNKRPTLDYELFETAVALADEGRALESLHKVLEHFFPGRPIPDLTKEPFSFVQGSSKVTVRIDGDDVVAAVALVKLPPGGSAIAAMRHVLTNIACTGQLHQPRLHGDDLYLEYRDAVSRMHPAKLVEVLQRMPAEADDNDDWLIGQFQATPFDRADIATLSTEDVKTAHAFWTSHWNEVDELLKDCQKKRSYFFLNELTAFAYNRAMATLPLHGFIHSRLREALSTFNDTSEDPMKREASLAKCSKDMKAVTLDDLGKNLGHVTYALPPVAQGTPKVLHAYIGDCDYMDTVAELKKGGKSMDAAFAFISTYYFLLVRFAWDEAIEKDFLAGLEKASGKPWKEVAQILTDHSAMMAEKYEDLEEDEDDDDEEEEGDEDGEEEETEEGDEE